jgi:hypothetical protein
MPVRGPSAHPATTIKPPRPKPRAVAGADVVAVPTRCLLGSFPYGTKRPPKCANAVPRQFVPGEGEWSLYIGPGPIRERTALNPPMTSTGAPAIHLPVVTILGKSDSPSMGPDLFLSPGAGMVASSRWRFGIQVFSAGWFGGVVCGSGHRDG